MRKAAIFVVSLALASTCFTACSNGTTAGDGGQTAEGARASGQTELPAIGSKESISIEDLESTVTTDVDETLASISAEYEAVVADIDSYEKYVENIGAVEAFYANALAETENLGIRLRQYSVDCVNSVLASDRTDGQKYDDLEAIYDVIYEDAGDDIYDGIYDGVLDDMYDSFYSGILDDAYDTVGYGEWSESLSNEYDLWSDAKSDVYDAWSDFKSDVYDLYSDVRSEVYGHDLERAKKKADEFQADIDALSE